MNKVNRKQRKKQQEFSTSKGARSVFLLSALSVLATSPPSAHGYVAFSRAQSSLLYKNLDTALDSEEVDSQSSQQQTISQHQIPQYHVSNLFYTWWTASKSQRAKRDAEAYAALHEQVEEQIILDKYLESIDKRYKRMHQRERNHLSDSVGSAWQWLLSGQTETSISLEERRKEDALYVLDLANLASKSLLEKHQLPIPKSKIQKQSLQVAVIDIKSGSLSKKSTSLMNLNLSSYIRKPLFSLPTFLKSRIQSSTLKFSRSLAPVLEMATTFTGGKQNIQFVSFFLAAFLASISSILRPLLSAHIHLK